MSNEPDRLIPATVVAGEHFNVSRRTLSRWMEDEKLSFPKATVIRNRLYFTASDIEAWKRQRAPQAA